MKHFTAIRPNQLLHFILCLTLWITADFSFAQNLVPNPDFETYSICPFVGDQNGPMVCQPWFSYYSCNYFNACFPGPYGVPDNFRGYQQAHSGQAYTGGYQHSSGPGGGLERLQVQLLEPLIAGQCYNVSYWASLSNESCPSNRLGALLTVEGGAMGNWPIPQIDVVQMYFSDTANWFQVFGTYVADGGEQFLTIGNLYTNSATMFDPTCSLDPATYSYYYFDDVLVEATETFPLDVDLGGPYEACDFLVLDSGIPGAHYVWSDGSHNSTLVVTTSGTYSVIVSFEGCISGQASADVTILGSPPVYLGSDVALCPGESYTINLDEFAGDYVWQDGSTDPEYTITSTGTYSVSLDDGCDISWDNINVTVLQPPEPFSLGPDTIICPGEVLTISFDPSLGDFTWQDNSTAPFYNIDDVGTYALTISNQCGEASDEIEITSIDPPQFSLGPDSLLLCIGDTIDLNFDQGMGDFTWLDGSTDPFYTITETGLYGLTVSNPCGLAEDQLYVMQISVPVVNLTGAIYLCPGDDLVLEAGNSYGDITWQDGSSDPEYVVTSSGIYSLTITNDCGMASGSVVVDIEDDISPPDLGPDTSICQGGDLLLEIAPIGSISWSDGSTGNQFLVTTSGTYFVDVHTDCESYSDTIHVTINNNGPDVVLPADYSICQGQITVIDAGISNVSYLLNDGSQLSQLHVSSPGIYSLTVTSACGTDVDSITILNGGLPPMVSFGADTSICPGDVITLFPSYANVNVWSWPDGSDTTFYVASASQQVYVQVANDCGVAVDTILIGLLPAVPTLSLGPDTAICPGTTLTLSIQIPNVGILWSDGSTNSDLILSDSTIVFAAISNSCGTSTDSLHVELLPDIPLLYLGPDQTICPGETIVISPDIPDVTYLWQDGSTGTTYQTSQQGVVSLMISNACGMAKDTIEITESTNGPQLDLGPDLQACEGETVTIPSGIFGVSYTWQDGSSDDQFTASVSGTYFLTVQNLCGTDSDTIEVVISGTPPVTNLGADTTLCIGSTLTLSSDADPSTSDIWQDGSTLHDFEVLVSGLYYLTQTNDCGVDSDSIEVLINGVEPVTDLGPDTTLCVGSNLILTANTDPSAANVWQDGSTSPTFEVIHSGNYYLTQTNDCGFDSDTIEVEISGVAPGPDLGRDTLLCEGASIVLISNADSSTEIVWSDGTNDPAFLVTSSGVYILSESNECGISKDSIEIGYIDSPAPFELGPDTVLCPGESILLSAPQTSFDIRWQDGSSLITLLADKAITYALEISNVCGKVSDSLSISFDSRVPDFPGDDSFSWCEGDTIVLEATQSFPVLYHWSTGEETSAIHVIHPGQYNVEVEAPCITVSREIDIIPLDDCNPDPEFYIPNIISPNGDIINDVFTVYTHPDLNIISMEGSIFDRWGNQVFYSSGITFIWDGRFKEKEISSGVYVYNIMIKYLLDGKEVAKRLIGDVTIIR